MVLALESKFSKGFSDYVEEEKRGRSLVISGVPEYPPNAKQADKLNDLDEKMFYVSNVDRLRSTGWEDIPTSVPSWLKSFFPQDRIG
ncbi:hypothetical protein ANCDUO_02053 [Ancylostoma duodenale]|uniref:Uncharacterized protein n=1 Tax=Ancylostoma duodenale TaxID=51022 RepID=A0A0C2HDJ4_9BILA|nr:hypothetical protein ANCDUO_02053 [Ancylostoma duodenale]